jgi:uncharacterized protein (TIGR04255 family)
VRQPATTRTRMRFKNAPVVELICGTLFSTPQTLSAPLIGLYWTRIRDRFPKLDVAPPLAPSIEQLGAAPQQNVQVFDFLQVPRTWMLSRDQTRLIQVQQDRFLYNWKREDDKTAYPSYEAVFAEFEKEFAEFREFLSQESIGLPELRQFELTYVDHIFESAVAGIPGGITGVLVDHVPDTSRTRFLSAPETLVWRSTYLLPESAGRLHITVQSAKRNSDGAPLLRLDFTARGFGRDGSDQSMKGWFDLAHDFIGHSFLDVTSQAVQRDVWVPES